jgi:protein gp37
MSDKSAIEWTDATWNPTRGCTKISPGCARCYAETFAERFRGVAGNPYERGFDPRLVPEKLHEPLKWRKPRRIFVNSMSDLFHEDFPDEYIDQVFAVMGVAHWHTFQVLTKRADRMAAYFAETWQVPAQPAARAYDIDILERPAHVENRWDRINRACDDIPSEVLGDHCWDGEDSLIGRPAWPRAPYPNVWLGVSVENQKYADARIPHLLKTPAAVRFLSCEPLIGPVDLTQFLTDEPSFTINTLARFYRTPDGKASEFNSDGDGKTYDRVVKNPLPLHWVIVGGESGHGARPMHPDWARSIRDQCQAAGVPMLFKQWGAWAPVGGDTPRGLKLIHAHARGGHTPAISRHEPGCPCDGMPSDVPMVLAGKKAAGRLLDGRTWDEFPEVAHA